MSTLLAENTPRSVRSRTVRVGEGQLHLARMGGHLRARRRSSGRQASREADASARQGESGRYARAMAPYHIRIFGDPVLKQRAAEVANVDGGLVRLAEDMIDTMRAGARHRVWPPRRSGCRSGCSSTSSKARSRPAPSSTR